ncbi:MULTISPECIES: helix-turn-helix domain-containing protein [Anaerococcus]|uniref:helix-turn-helix domain-containing protein n=1 Tax=Anaerococcus TaxID=165779 RepID=UPI002900178E|nr:helix-turn-helix transcriptional regulator [Anaerococcus sp.]MDU2598237.1 helix-turn-helix transcriptional regulator [Anaerococcus sp.]
MEDKLKFGKFLEKRRKKLGLTLRGLAGELEIAPAYLSDIEKGRRNPSDDKLKAIIAALKFSEEESFYVLDLAAKAKENTVSADLPDYIMDTDLARVALRRAKEGNLSDEGWNDVIKLIDSKINDGD